MHGALARKHGVPVRWNESRSENTQATIQGRGQIQHIELAADADGKLTALRVRLLGDMGAYLQLVTPGIPLLGRSSTPACTTCRRRTTSSARRCSRR